MEDAAPAVSCDLYRAPRRTDLTAPKVLRIAPRLAMEMKV